MANNRAICLRIRGFMKHDRIAGVEINRICNKERGAKYAWCDRHRMRSVRWKRNKENEFWWPLDTAFLFVDTLSNNLWCQESGENKTKWQSSLIGGKPSSAMAATGKPVSFPSPSLGVSQRPSLDYIQALFIWYTHCIPCRAPLCGSYLRF